MAIRSYFIGFVVSFGLVGCGGGGGGDDGSAGTGGMGTGGSGASSGAGAMAGAAGAGTGGMGTGGMGTGGTGTGGSAGSAGTASMVVGPSGGMVQADGAQVFIPAGALSGDVEITIERVDPSTLPDPANSLGDAYDFGPDGTQFSAPVTITLPLLAAPANGQTAVMSWLDSSSQWVDIGSETFGFREISAQIDHFTPFNPRAAAGNPATTRFEGVLANGARQAGTDDQGWGEYNITASIATIAGNVGPDGIGRYRFANWDTYGGLAGEFDISGGQFSFDVLIPGGQQFVTLETDESTFFMQINRGCAGTCPMGTSFFNLSVAPGTLVSEATGVSTYTTDADTITFAGMTNPVGTADYMILDTRPILGSFPVTQMGTNGEFSADITLKPGQNIIFVENEGAVVHVLDITTTGGCPGANCTSPTCATSVSSIPMTGTPQFVATGGNLAAVALSTANIVQLVDITNPAAPALGGTVPITSASGAQQMAFAGSTMFIADGANGLLVVDVSNPAAPTQLGSWVPNSEAALTSLVTPPIDSRSVVAGTGVVYVGNSREILSVIDVSTPSAPTMSGFVRQAETEKMDFLALNGTTLFGSRDINKICVPVACPPFYGMSAVDVSNPASPTFSSEIATRAGAARSFVLKGTHALMTSGAANVEVVDVGTPGALSVATTFGFPTSPARAVALSGDRLFVTAGTAAANLTVVDATDPTSMTVTHENPLALPSELPRTLAISGTHALVGRNSSVAVLDISGCL